MTILGKSVLQGVTEALEYAKGNRSHSKTHAIKIPDEVNVGLIRDNLHMTRQEFANTFGFSIRTLEKWERGERHPEGPARAYLLVIAKSPAAVVKALYS